MSRQQDEEVVKEAIYYASRWALREVLFEMFISGDLFKGGEASK